MLWVAGEKVAAVRSGVRVRAKMMTSCFFSRLIRFFSHFLCGRSFVLFNLKLAVTADAAAAASAQATAHGVNLNDLFPSLFATHASHCRLIRRSPPQTKSDMRWFGANKFIFGCVIVSDVRVALIN